jgi:hypothetical protein
VMVLWVDGANVWAEFGCRKKRIGVIANRSRAGASDSLCNSLDASANNFFFGLA